MGRGQFGAAVQQYQHLLDGDSVVGISEWQLLRRYLDRRDEVAFGAIVERHGPMVLGVCRRILGDARDVEDSFQATFLILARKGATLRENDPVGHWLYGVARRVALRARASSSRRRTREQGGTAPEVATVEDPSRHELGGIIDEELARLPSKYRAPVVLCYLEGLTHEEAAGRLGWPLGSVKGRLSRARDLLKGRLARRGFAPTGAAWPFLPVAVAVVPPSLLQSTIRAAMAGPASGVVPAGVASLAAGSLATMFLNKLKLGGALLLVLGTGAAVMAYQATKEAGDAPRQDRGPIAPSPAKPSATKSATEVPDWVAGWPSLMVQDEQDPKTKSIHKKLAERISMGFPNDTPLEDVIKYIQQCTQDEAAGLPTGIPIYLNPQGLMDTNKTTVSTIRMNLEGIPLRVSLALALRQLGLAFKVEDGLLSIDSEEAIESTTPLMILEGKAIRGELTREQYQQLIEMLKLRNEVISLTTPPVGRGENAAGTPRPVKP